ncbi:FRIGIDA-like protein 3 [Impatiens glandulifera]|uniref:FRIGIDA-like protein 3 n=1 Tax=Impatiens glandulifera TaxID=253017 RepID=UPI001FB13741|nr:FRIGIDA-like protein 3 [Impatiens glandulifera]
MEFYKFTSLVEQLGKAFQELKDHEDSKKDSVQWVELEEYYNNLQTMMQDKVQDLEIKKMQFGEKVLDAQKLIAEREAVIFAKEQDLADRIQVIKDAAVYAINEARESHQPKNIEIAQNGDKKEIKVNIGNTENKTSEIAEEGPVKVNPRPELIQFCEQNDANGLLNYSMENRIDLPSLCSELSVALEAATEPCQLILDSLDAAPKGMHDECCLMFLDALATLLARADDQLLTIQIKLQAKRIADEWKPILDAANGISLEEAEAFLQLIATFRLASEFNEEELCKLVLAIAHHRRAPELCRSLGLTAKIPGLIEDLINNGKQIDASRFIHAFQLDVQFPLVPLLKVYLKDLRRNSQGNRLHSARNGHQNDGNAKELAALKVVIECIQEYKLEDEYPLDPLLVRVRQLDKPKSEKKRFPESGKYPPRKRSRPNRNRPSPSVGGVSIYSERPVYLNMPDWRYTHTGQTIYEYQTPPNQPVYTQQHEPQQQVHEARAYYYAQDDQSTQPGYGGSYATGGGGGAGIQPSYQHQPYM